jgi:hypothetical protein
MVPRSAQRKKEAERKGADSRWEQVIGNMDKLIGVKIRRIQIKERVRGLTGKKGELNAQEAKLLPEAAEYATKLRDALESRSTRKLEKVA